MKKVLFTVAATAAISTSYAVAAEASSHEVESGDSLWSIAKKYDTTVNSLKKLNGLSSDVIFPKQVLKIDGSTPAKAQPTTKTTTKEVKEQTTQEKTYQVVSGDTLLGIANNHSITLAELKSWNKLNDYLIYPGQKLVVSRKTVSSSSEPASSDKKEEKAAEPKESTAQTTYSVVSGDSLLRIALNHDVTVSQLKEWNKLKNDTIYIGQKLKIHANPSTVKEPAKDKAKSDNLGVNVEELLEEAKFHIGTPYAWGGSSAGGFDCSGFIYYVYKEAGMNISRQSSGGYYNRSYYVDKPEPGDLVFFENTYKKGISHVGIYVGDNKFIHAGDSGVQITSLDHSYWKSKFDGFKRFY
ncbi:LysM peptidoglycan-binding domain-containing protein [Bacillus sp. SCS-153A]|uniref:C40 family peptidase n=1 Tax=Rossellomorea sedimentorum TaxID=3115294 RepID=UPI00390583ED